MKLRRLLPLFVLVCAFAAGERPFAQAPAQDQKLTMAGYPTPGSPAVVTIISTGNAPKKQLRYTIAATHKATMDMSTSMSMRTSAAGMEIPMDMPTINMSVDLAVTGIATNGDITYSLAFTGVKIVPGPDANPMVMQAMEAGIAAINGMKGTSTMTTRGQTKSTKMDVADPAAQAAMSQMGGSLESLTVPFPEEAVGVGAKWEARQGLSAGGQTSFQKSMYEITAMDASSVTMKISTEQTAPPQSVSSPMAAGMEMKLEKMSGTGTGTVVIRLDSLVPTMTMESTTSTAMSMDMAGQTMAVTADGKIKMSVAPGKIK